MIKFYFWTIWNISNFFIITCVTFWVNFSYIFLDGKILEEYTNVNTSVTLDISHFKSGIYLLQLTNEEAKSEFVRLIKEW